MEPWQYSLLAALSGILLAVLALRGAMRKKRKQKQRDFDRKLETVLQPKETVQVVCPQSRGRCVLTSSRLLFETKEGFTAVPFAKIKQLQGVTSDGKKTTSAAKMKRLTIKAGQEYVIENNAEEFLDLVKQLKAKTAKKKK